jgi:hypothetical protein
MGRKKSSRGRSPASRRKTARTQPTSAQSPPARAGQHEMDPKRRGELSELAFTHKAASLGFGVAKPYGDSERYDFILDSRDLRRRAPRGIPPPDRLSRVQVKCSTQLAKGLYRTNAHRHLNGRVVPYLPSEIDFIVIHIVPEDTWYIIPIRAVNGRTSLLFRRKRDRKPGTYDQYREAWRLLRPKD